MDPNTPDAGSTGNMLLPSSASPRGHLDCDSSGYDGDNESDSVFSPESDVHSESGSFNARSEDLTVRRVSVRLPKSPAGERADLGAKKVPLHNILGLGQEPIGRLSRLPYQVPRDRTRYLHVAFPEG